MFNSYCCGLKVSIDSLQALIYPSAGNIVKNVLLSYFFYDCSRVQVLCSFLKIAVFKAKSWNKCHVLSFFRLGGSSPGAFLW